jgi:N-formylglutamate amidohydrolase
MIELNRRLSMDERTGERAEGFSRLAEDLKAVSEDLRLVLAPDESMQCAEDTETTTPDLPRQREES